MIAMGGMVDHASLLEVVKMLPRSELFSPRLSHCLFFRWIAICFLCALLVLKLSLVH